MRKTILITGATDGIGEVTAKLLAENGHKVLLHGRDQARLDKVQADIQGADQSAQTDSFIADLSDFSAIDAMADAVLDRYDSLDVLINNAGILKTAHPVTAEGLDIRFVVNTIAPYRLMQRLKPIIGTAGRVVNLSSAAQAPINIDALNGKIKLEAMDAYSQSKLAITGYSHELARESDSPIIIAVNPASLLGSKMVKEGFGIDGGDLRIGADILIKASLDEDFSHRSGQYFDNDAGNFAPPHADALDTEKNKLLIATIDALISKYADAA